MAHLTFISGDFYVFNTFSIVSEKQDCIIITWAEEETATIFCISGEGVAKEDIIKVARNIQE